MKEIITMWKYNTMVALTFLSAGIYMLFLLPFKSIPIIPGFTEIRPATIFPVIFGLLFGPAGAWGAALGNLAGDCFGTLSTGSIFGFIGNFFFAYIPYKLWGRLKLGYSRDGTPTINSSWKLVEFGIVSVIASISCAVVIAWGIDILKLVPFVQLVEIITLNNIVANLLFGPILLPIAYRLAKKLGILWSEVMHVRDISRPNPERIYPFMIFAGAIGGLFFGVLLSFLFAGISIFGAEPTANGAGNMLVGIGVLPFLVVLIYGTLNA